MAGQIESYQRIIESMNEGVMTLSPKGHITMFNDTAGKILGIRPANVLDRPFGQVFMMDMEGNDGFCQLIMDAVYASAIGKTDTIDFKRPDGGKQTLSVSSSYLKPDDSGARDSGGVVVVINDITEITRSREKEKELNLQLREAFIEAEETNKKLTAALKKVQLVRVVITIAVVLGFVGTGYALWQEDLLPTLYFADRNDPQETQLDMRTAPARVQPLSSSIYLSGVVAPLEEINVVAPYDGKIKERYFVYDQKVEKGARLFAMDTSQLEMKLREAKTSYIKARQNYRQLKDWEKSTEVAQSRRSFTKAQNSLDTSKRKLEETKLLFEKGIVSRSEFESAQAEYVNQKLDFTAAKEGLSAAMDKASPDNLAIAQMELANAQASLKEVEERLTHTVVHAPVTGIMIMPMGDQGGNAGQGKKLVESGVSVSQGDILVSIGNMDGLSVKAKVDEIDIGKIGFDMKVHVSGDAFSDIPMTGRVRQISSNAVSSGMEGPMFDVGICIDQLTEAQKRRIRLGMSTNLEIMVYENPQALLVPLSAVEVRGNEKFVRVLESDSGVPRAVQVTTGMTTLDSVEILSGLSPEDRVILSGQGAMPAQAGTSPEHNSPGIPMGN